MDTLTETETAVYRQTYQQRLARQYQARENCFMNEPIRLLQAEIRQDLKTVNFYVF